MSSKDVQRGDVLKRGLTRWPFVFLLAAIPIAIVVHNYGAKEEARLAAQERVRQADAQALKQLTTFNAGLLDAWRAETRRGPAAGTNALMRESLRTVFRSCSEIKAGAEQYVATGNTKYQPAFQAAITGCIHLGEAESQKSLTPGLVYYVNSEVLDTTDDILSGRAPDAHLKQMQKHEAELDASHDNVTAMAHWKATLPQNTK